MDSNNSSSSESTGYSEKSKVSRGIDSDSNYQTLLHEQPTVNTSSQEISTSTNQKDIGNTSRQRDVGKSKSKAKKLDYLITVGTFALLALLSSGGYLYWKAYEGSQNKLAVAQELYEKGCQRSRWRNINAVATAEENFNQATKLLQAVPNIPASGYDTAQNKLAAISQCRQELQSAAQPLNYHLALTQQVQTLVNDFIEFSNQLSPHLGYQGYTDRLQNLNSQLQNFKQSEQFAYIQSQDSLESLRKSLSALENAQNDLLFASRVWSYCQVEGACFRGLRTSEEFLPTSSNPIPEVTAILINSYGLTSKQPMGGWVLLRNGILLNESLDTVWKFARQDLLEAQQGANAEMINLKGDSQSAPN